MRLNINANITKLNKEYPSEMLMVKFHCERVVNHLHDLMDAVKRDGGYRHDLHFGFVKDIRFSSDVICFKAHQMGLIILDEDGICNHVKRMTIAAELNEIFYEEDLRSVG